MTSYKDTSHIVEWLQTWDQLMTQVQQFTPESVIQSPAPGSWSVQEVVQHLALSEHLSLRYLRKKTLDPSAIPPKDFSYPIRKGLLYLYLVSPFKFKAPPMVSAEQFPDEKMDTTLAGLRSNQEALLTFIDNMPDQAKTGLVYRHPIAGRTDLKGMFQFFTWHIKHHSHQINRIGNLLKVRENQRYRPS